MSGFLREELLSSWLPVVFTHVKEASGVDLLALSVTTAFLTKATFFNLSRRHSSKDINGGYPHAPDLPKANGMRTVEISRAELPSRKLIQHSCWSSDSHPLGAVLFVGVMVTYPDCWHGVCLS